MKKVLALVLSVLMLVSIAAPAFATDTPKATTTASATTLKRGDEVTFTLTLDQEVEVKSGGVQFFETGTDPDFDSDVFEYVDGWWEMRKVTLNDANERGGAFAFKDSTKISGDIYVLEMKVKEDAPFGSTDITLGLDLANGDASVEVSNVGATVTITHDCVPATTYSRDAEGHWYDCTVDGCAVAEPKIPHTWANACDTTCEDCGYVREGGHTWGAVVDDRYYVEGSLTCEDAAEYKKSCEVCGEAHPTETFRSGNPDESLHKGGEASCTDRAVCTVCGNPYGDLTPHNYTKKVEAQYLVSAATCNAKAVYYKSCSECGAQGTETFETGSFDESKHDYQDVVDSKYLAGTTTCKDPATYYKSCTVCEKAHPTATFTSGEPDVSLHEGGTATCTQKAVCTVCGLPYGELKSHDYTEKADARYLLSEATCNKKAVYSKSCSDCGAEHPTATFESGEFDETKHVFDAQKAEAQYLVSAATCNKKAVYKVSCSVCGKAHATATFESGEFDETKHVFDAQKAEAQYLVSAATCNKKAVYKVSCSVCGKAHATATFESGEFDETKHVFDAQKAEAQYLVSAATCVDKAEYKVSCSVCGEAHDSLTFETGDVDQDNHVGGTVTKNEKPVSCKEPGFTGDTHCDSCDKKLVSGSDIEKYAHMIETWIVTKPASETEEGEKKGVCIECEEEITVKLAKLTTSVKTENIEGIEGAKVEAVGDTKLPENLEAMVEDYTEIIMNDPEEVARLEEMIDTEVPEAKGKDVFAGAIAVVVLGEEATNGDSVVSGEGYQLPGKIKVSIPMNEELFAKYENIVAVTMNEKGELVVLPFTYENGVVTFETDNEANEVVFTGDLKKVPAPTPDSSVPATGDSSHILLFVTLSIVSVLTLGGLIVSKKKVTK